MKRVAYYTAILAVVAIMIWLFCSRSSERRLPTRVTKDVSRSAKSEESTSKTKSDSALTAAKDIERSEFADAVSREKGKVDVLRRVYSADIVFYGRVIDESSAPIPAANISFAIGDKFFGEGTKLSRKSDADGDFELEGVKGASLYVAVSKVGYYRIVGKSERSFGYSIPSGEAPPTKEKPAIFVLGEAHPHGSIRSVVGKEIPMVMDGMEIAINLLTGEVGSDGKSSAHLSCRTDYERHENGRYSWSFEVSIPSGGLIVRTDQYAFEAPESGYQPADKQTILFDTERWSPSSDRDYFVKFESGMYGRLHVVLATHGQHYAVLTSYINESGSRDTEVGADQHGNPR
jgi:hypothetical protein